MATSRNFSSTMQVTNNSHISSDTSKHAPQANNINVSFILLENFSMMAFTAAVDVLITANLVQTNTFFTVANYGLTSTNVISDLNINIATTSTLNTIVFDTDSKPDVLIVCGGLRSDLTHNSKLSHLLKRASNSGSILGGIWNGAIALAQADVLKDTQCSLHINNHPLMHERFPAVNLTENSYTNTPRLISCADALGALQMMLKLINDLIGPEVFRAVREILACNRSIENGVEKLSQHGDNEQLPDLLRNAIQLMNNNIEDPISIDEMAQLINIHRRQLERLFKQHLNTSPSKHYLEIRLTYARRLLIQSYASITDITIASGFSNSNHFSNCFRQYFKISPSEYRKKERTTQKQ